MKREASVEDTDPVRLPLERELCWLTAASKMQQTGSFFTWRENPLKESNKQCVIVDVFYFWRHFRD